MIYARSAAPLSSRAPQGVAESPPGLLGFFIPLSGLVRARGAFGCADVRPAGGERIAVSPPLVVLPGPDGPGFFKWLKDMTLPLQNRNDTAIKVWLPEHIENDLRELAERDGLAVSVLVRMLIKRHLARVRESETLADCADI